MNKTISEMWNDKLNKLNNQMKNRRINMYILIEKVNTSLLNKRNKKR